MVVLQRRPQLVAPVADADLRQDVFLVSRCQEATWGYLANAGSVHS